MAISKHIPEYHHCNYSSRQTIGNACTIGTRKLRANVVEVSKISVFEILVQGIYVCFVTVSLFWTCTSVACMCRKVDTLICTHTHTHIIHRNELICIYSSLSACKDIRTWRPCFGMMGMREEETILQRRYIHGRTHGGKEWWPHRSLARLHECIYVFVSVYALSCGILNEVIKRSFPYLNVYVNIVVVMQTLWRTMIRDISISQLFRHTIAWIETRRHTRTRVWQ